MKPTFAISALAVVCAACGDPESVFTANRSLVDCSQSLPVCSSTAGCVLDNASYAQGAFQQGGTTRFIVRTQGAAEVQVSIFFLTEESSGTDTEITWNEVACTKQYSADSNGIDIFNAAGQARVYSQMQKLTTAGDHLIEVFSDAEAQVLLDVTVNGGQ